MKRILSIGVAALAIAAAPANAAQIVLNGSSVVGSSGGFGTAWTPDNIVDQQTGPITETFADFKYWLNPDDRTGAFITLDLGAAYRLGSIQLFNTRNGNNADRGTAQFEIRAGNALVSAAGTSVGASGSRLGASAGTIVAGRLDWDPVTPGQPVPIAAQTFGVSDTTAYRYIEFRPLTSSNGANRQQTGLNELRVFEAEAVSAVPEPATWAMMIGGFGVVGGTLRRRRSPAASVA